MRAETLVIRQGYGLAATGAAAALRPNYFCVWAAATERPLCRHTDHAY